MSFAVVATTAGTLLLGGAYGLAAVVPACVWLGYLWHPDRRVSAFLCPACGKWFTRLPNGFHYDLTRRCLHCGIEMGTLQGSRERPPHIPQRHPR
jgi:predicted RNA-binding Zn-ribbon protein involved in translation (DUF1610 family)